MDLRQLHVFVRVAEDGSFSRAAESLHMAQPSLSKQVRRLEVELRQTLFARNGRGVVLTDVGKCFFEHAQAVLASVERARLAVREFREAESGKVVIGLPPRIARFLSVPLLEAFKARFPKASLSVAEGLSMTLHEWLLLGRLDLAVLFEPLRTVDLEVEPLSWDELVFVGRRKGRMAVPDLVPVKNLARYPLILPRAPNTTRVLVEEACKRAGVELDVAAEVDTVQSILEFVSRNDLYSIIPRGTLINQPSPLLKTARCSPSLRTKMLLAWCKKRPLTRLATSTRQLLLGMEVARLLGQHSLSSG